MKLYKLIFLFLAFVPLAGIAQVNPVYNDTAYFIPFDEDFNLIMSSSKGHLNNVVQLLNRGADIDAVTIDGISALMYAAENGDLEMVKLLVEKGASPDLKPYNGMTALMSACKLNFYTIAEYLVSNGANINLSDEEGVSALHYAAAYNYTDLIKMLVFYKADIQKPDKEGNTPLITASFNNCIESVKLLLENGAEADKQDKLGFTALMVATQQSNREIVKFLIEKGADVNLSNHGGMTPLGFAIQAGDYEMAELLIQNGADVNHRISNSQNLLELSKDSEDETITELLITEGARNNYAPGFNRMSAGTGLLFCSREFMTGVDYKLIDSKYNIALTSGFYFRPKAIRVQTWPLNDTLYQYWEKRFSIHAGLEKRFPAISSGEKQAGPFAGVNALYSFGGYRGSSDRPEDGIFFNPYAGWYYRNRYISLAAQYEYLNLDLPLYKKGRIKLSFAFNISGSAKKHTTKRIDWLNQ